jgi:hypothetical protein
LVAGRPTYSMQESFSKFLVALKPFGQLRSARAVEVWGTALSNLLVLSRDLGGQVGSLTPPIVGRLIVDHINAALGSMGGGAGKSLVELVEEIVGDGRCLPSPCSSLSIPQLVLLLQGVAFTEKLQWISSVKDTQAAEIVRLQAKVSALEVPSTAGGRPTGSRGLCYSYSATNSCQYGDACRFAHGKPAGSAAA